VFMQEENNKSAYYSFNISSLLIPSRAGWRNQFHNSV
jgi:hypothetical protein